MLGSLNCRKIVISAAANIVGRVRKRRNYQRAI
jgi:hypothetical protein